MVSPVETGGERVEFVDLGGRGPCGFEGVAIRVTCVGVFVFGPLFPAAQPLAATYGDCAVVEEQGDSELFGRAASRTIIRLPETPVDEPACWWVVDFPGAGQFQVEQSHRLALYEVEVSGQPLWVVVAAPESSFEKYFEEEAQPVLDSIVFLDQ